MTSAGYQAELKRLVIETDSLRGLASRYVKGADVDEVARRTLNELSQLCPESVVGIQDLRSFARRVMRCHVLDVVMERNRVPLQLDATSKGAGAPSLRERDRWILRAAVSQLDGLEQAVIAQMLRGHSILRTAKRLGLVLNDATGADECSLRRIRDILDAWTQATPMRGAENNADTRAQAAHWVLVLHTSEEIARLLPQFIHWWRATPENRYEYSQLQETWRGLVGLSDDRLLDDIPAPPPEATASARKSTARGDSQLGMFEVSHWLRSLSVSLVACCTAFIGLQFYNSREHCSGCRVARARSPLPMARQ
jgi:hypothetical protein